MLLSLYHLCVVLLGFFGARAPHLLELDTNFGKGLDDHGNEHVLDEPREEKDHREEVEVSFPGRQAIVGSVH